MRADAGGSCDAIHRGMTSSRGSVEILARATVRSYLGNKYRNRHADFVRTPALLIGSVLLCLGASVQAASALAPLRLAPCEQQYEFSDVMDYLDPQFRTRIGGIEHNHLNSDVEQLIKGQSTASPGGDLRFILGYVPNHHRALSALMRLSLRDRTEMPAESGPLTVRCWLDRATVFSPQDGTSFMLYGIYLARNRLDAEAAKQLEKAAQLMPDNVDVSYNLGLIYLELKDYDKAVAQAKLAYAAGYPLPGLKQKLAAAGRPLH
jgi:tetratricopeptide (TPR) repeat protein